MAAEALFDHRLGITLNMMANSRLSEISKYESALMSAIASASAVNMVMRARVII
jgi:hypothetical protein